MLKNLFKTLSIFIFLLFTNHINLSSQSSDLYFYNKLGVKEGLSQSKVQSILNDSQGNIWIGTVSGLNRYKNGEIKQYTNLEKENRGLSSNNVQFIVEDAQLNIWVATQSNLFIYDRKNDIFKKIVFNKYPNAYINSYLLVDDGIIVGGENCILKYEYNNSCWKTLYSNHIPYIRIRKMLLLNSDTILFSSWSGLYLFDLKENKTKEFHILGNKYYTCIYKDSQNRLWLSPYGEGLYCFENNELIKHYHTKNSQLNYDVIYDIVEKKDQLWIATDGGGINILSLKTETFSYITHTQDDLSSFPDNAVCRMYLDKANNLWAGTVFSGLICIKEVYAHSYTEVPFNNPYGLSRSTINTIIQDTKGMVWLATDGGGINQFDSTHKTFKHYINTQNYKITSIVEFNPSNLLIFSYNKGFYLFNKEKGFIEPFPKLSQKIYQLFNTYGISVTMHKISENKVLLIMKDTYLYDIKSNELKMIAQYNKDYNTYTPQVIESDQEKIRFLDSKNIYEYNIEKSEINLIYNSPNSLMDGSIDDHGVYWLATADGLISFDAQTQKSNLIKTSLFKEAISVVPDKQDRVWIATRKGLFVYNIKEKNIIIFDETNGVSKNEYKANSNLLLHNGDILIGGYNGLTFINSNVIFHKDNNALIDLYHIKLNGAIVSVKDDTNKKIKSIKIPWNYNSLELNVHVNTNDIFKNTVLLFSIKELNKEVLSSSRNPLSLNFLPIGKYTLSASYYTIEGKWSTKQDILNIEITTPWWKTKWFYLSIIVLLLLIVFISFYFILQKKKIQHQKEIFQLKNKIYEDKIQFLTNVSHELRTPLTLICAPLKRMIDQKVEKNEHQSLLELIYNQANQIKNMVDLILDIRKLEEGKETLHLISIDLNQWIQDVSSKFTYEFKTKDILLEYELDNRIGKVAFDAKKCEIVLSNFLTNTLKFAYTNTSTIIKTHLSDDMKWIKISISDEGIGLENVHIDSLFKTFYQGNHNEKGSGIGLAYAKSLISLHKGKIGANKNENKPGATFYFELPVNNSDILNEFNKEENIIKCNTENRNNVDFSILKKYTIIIVEDTNDLRVYLKNTLKQYFQKVYIAKDGLEGLLQIKKHLPDIIISDLMMPQMNGFDLCVKVKTDLSISHIPFVLFTAYNNPQNMSIGYKMGADAFIPKPFEIDNLLTLSINQLSIREKIKERYKKDQMLDSIEASFSNADEKFLSKLNALINDNLENPEIDVSFLAANMYISRSLLFKKIKSITGLGVVDYLNKQRIEKSICLMNSSTMNLSEICELVGFSSLRYFSKVFKQFKGDIPSNYRKNMLVDKRQDIDQLQQ